MRAMSVPGVVAKSHRDPGILFAQGTSGTFAVRTAIQTGVFLSQIVHLPARMDAVGTVASGVHDSRPPTEIQSVVAYGSMAIVGGWFLIKGWSICRGRGAKRR
jgi:hypothetical protein